MNFSSQIIYKLYIRTYWNLMMVKLFRKPRIVDLLNLEWTVEYIYGYNYRNSIKFLNTIPQKAKTFENMGQIWNRGSLWSKVLAEYWAAPCYFCDNLKHTFQYRSESNNNLLIISSGHFLQNIILLYYYPTHLIINWTQLHWLKSDISNEKSFFASPKLMI